MTDPLLPVGDGQTPLAPEDVDGLSLTYITTRGELNDAEQRNIAAAVIRRRPPTVEQLLDDLYLRDLHAAMFSDVWEWAGRYRLRETNLGIDPRQIAIAVRHLVDDCRMWVAQATFDGDEIAVRLHHQLVVIHPFPNGNGRHARIAADHLAEALERDPFTWGAQRATTTVELRTAYLDALRLADRGEVTSLIAFARS